MRKWKPSDVKCFKAVWISIYGIPCHVISVRFLEFLLSGIGSILNIEFLENKPERLDVLSFIVFSKSVEMIRSKVNACINGGWKRPSGCGHDFLIRTNIFSDPIAVDVSTKINVSPNHQRLAHTGNLEKGEVSFDE